MPKLSKAGKSIIPKTILYNRYLLYFIFVIVLGNVVQLMTQGDYLSMVIMVVVGLLTSFFSKNMIVILCIALVVTNLLKYGTKLRVEGFKKKGKEGMEGDMEEAQAQAQAQAQAEADSPVLEEEEEEEAEAEAGSE